jgi:hypothetical protein
VQDVTVLVTTWGNEFCVTLKNCSDGQAEQI